MRFCRSPTSPIAPPPSSKTSMAGKNAASIWDEPIPVHLGYFTHSLDEAGAIRRFADING